MIEPMLLEGDLPLPIPRPLKKFIPDSPDDSWEGGGHRYKLYCQILPVEVGHSFVFEIWRDNEPFRACRFDVEVLEDFRRALEMAIYVLFEGIEGIGV